MIFANNGGTEKGSTMLIQVENLMDGWKPLGYIFNEILGHVCTSLSSYSLITHIRQSKCMNTIIWYYTCLRTWYTLYGFRTQLISALAPAKPSSPDFNLSVPRPLLHYYYDSVQSIRKIINKKNWGGLYLRWRTLHPSLPHRTQPLHPSPLPPAMPRCLPSSCRRRPSCHWLPLATTPLPRQPQWWTSAPATAAAPIAATTAKSPTTATPQAALPFARTNPRLWYISIMYNLSGHVLFILLILGNMRPPVKYPRSYEAPC